MTGEIVAAVLIFLIGMAVLAPISIDLLQQCRRLAAAAATETIGGLHVQRQGDAAVLVITVHPSGRQIGLGLDDSARVALVDAITKIAFDIGIDADLASAAAAKDLDRVVREHKAP